MVPKKLDDCCANIDKGLRILAEVGSLDLVQIIVRDLAHKIVLLLPCGGKVTPIPAQTAWPKILTGLSEGKKPGT
jgi:hypothetical protein